MLLVGAAGMIVCHFIVAAISTATDSSNQPAQKALVAFVCFFIAFFAATWGPIAWVVTGEIYPTSTRAKQMSMSTASNWLWSESRLRETRLHEWIRFADTRLNSFRLWYRLRHPVPCQHRSG